jgi:hypothetical protein
VGDDYSNLMVTDEFVASLQGLDPAPSEDDVEGILAALDELDSEPTNLRNRLHRLDRELKEWWSLTPPEPADPSLRILVRPERTARGGIWRIGPVTWHYTR